MTDRRERMMASKTPDHIEKWTDEATGYECVAVAIPWWCAYVQVPADHPWHGKGYSQPLCGGHDGCYKHTPEALISVHGGITFSGEPMGADSGHWFGFDCAHYNDYCDYGVPGISPREGHRWTLDEVKAECASMAKQLADVSAGRVSPDAE